MRIVLTGHRGFVGRDVARALRADGHDVLGFDIIDGDDLLDRAAVIERARGCDVIVHAGALAHDSAGTPEQIAAINVDGTRHVLDAATKAGARVVNFSSAQVFGLEAGAHEPAYLPIDDDHPRFAALPYGRSKCDGEDLCETFSARTGLPTVSLRPFWVWDDARYRTQAEAWAWRPESEWEPSWGLGAFVDRRDVTEAVRRAIATDWDGSVAVSLCADDMAATKPAAALIAHLLPDVEWRGPRSLADYGTQSLVDTSRAREVLGWRPQHTWAAHTAAREVGSSRDGSR